MRCAASPLFTVETVERLEAWLWDPGPPAHMVPLYEFVDESIWVETSSLKAAAPWARLPWRRTVVQKLEADISRNHVSSRDSALHLCGLWPTVRSGRAWPATPPTSWTTGTYAMDATLPPMFSRT